MSDLLAQALLMQARQQRPQSTQARLAQQMLAQMTAPPTNAGIIDPIARAASGIFGTLMAQRADAEERAREKQGMGALMSYADQQRQEHQAEMQAIMRMAGLGGAPAAAPSAGMPAAPAEGPAPSIVPAPSGMRYGGPAASMPDMRGEPGYDAAAASAARTQLAGQPLVNPARPGEAAPVPSWDAGIAPPTGRINAAIGAAPTTAPMAAPAAPTGNANFEAAALAAAQSTNPRTQALAPLLMGMARREAPNLTSVSPGSALVDPRTGRVVAQIPERPDENERLLALAGLRPGTPEFQQMARAIAERRGAPPTTNVNVDNRADSALLRADTDTMKTINEGTMQARGLMSLFDRAETAIRATPEGAGAQFAPIIGQVARSLGFDIQGTSEAEVLRSIQNQMASLQRLPGSGATSDRDMALFLQAVPRLGNTREGNLALVDMGRRLMQRRIEEAGVWRRNIGSPDLQDRLDALGPVFNERDREMLMGGAIQSLRQSVQPQPQAPAPMGAVQGPAPGMTATPPSGPAPRIRTFNPATGRLE